MNPQNIYIGMRYVPKYMGTWDESTEYEALSIVLGTDGNGYTSKKPVPAGTPTSNKDYWALTGSANSVTDNLSSQIIDLTNKIEQSNGEIDKINNNTWWLNALDEGFKNDGASLNDTAFNSLGNKTGYIVFPSGTYKVGSTFTCNLIPIFMPGAIISTDTDITSGSKIFANFTNGIIAGENKIFDGAIMPRYSENVYFPIWFDWWLENNSNAVNNSNVLNFIITTDNTQNIVLYFKEKEYTFDSNKTLGNRTHNIIVTQDVTFNSPSGKYLGVPPGYYENVTFNTDSTFNNISTQQEYNATFKNCKINCYKIGSRNYINRNFYECVITCISYADSLTFEFMSVTNICEIKNTKFIMTYTQNSTHTEDNRVIKIGEGRNGIDNIIIQNISIDKTGENKSQIGVLFRVEGGANVTISDVFVQGVVSRLLYSTNSGNIDINNVKSTAYLNSLIEKFYGDGNINFENYYGYTCQGNDENDIITCGSTASGKITLKNMLFDCSVCPTAPKIVNNGKTSIDGFNISVKNGTVKGINANSGTFIDCDIDSFSGTAKGFNIKYNDKRYTIYPVEKTIIGYALTGSNTTLSKGSSTPMQLELVKLYSDGTYENVGAPTEANVRVIGNNSEQTIYNGSGTLRIGSDETAKAIMLTYSGSDSNNMIASMVITIT